jgi:hypothetical protein
MEKRQLENCQALQSLLGFLAIIACRLLQLRTISRNHSNTLAISFIPQHFITVLTALGLLPDSNITVSQFWKAVARLGGFIGRKCDGNPGWQTLWFGWQRLLDLSWSVPLPST